MNPSEFCRQTLELLEQGRAIWMVTVAAAEGSTPQKAGAKMLVAADGSIWGTIGGGDIERVLIEQVCREQPAAPLLIKHILTEKDRSPGGPQMACGGAMQVLIEPLNTGPQLFIFGGGHCGVELSRLAARTGFAVTVIDNRPEWAAREKHPDARVICAPYEDAAQHVRFGPDCHVVIMTHNHANDEQVVRLCLPGETRFLGCIGSPNKARIMRENLARNDISAEDVARLHCPVGLEIGSHTPAEIAVSIMAQLIALRHNLP